MKPRTNHSYRKSTGLKIIWRYIVVSLLILFFASVIVWFMFRTTVTQADLWITKANEQLQKRDTIWPERGDILAADGSILATNIRQYTLRIDFKASKFDEKQFRADLPALCDTMAMFHPEKTRQQWMEKFEAELAKPAAKRSSSFPLLANLTYEQAKSVEKYPFFRRSSNKNRTGLTSETKVIRCYPYGEMARRTIGRVGETSYSRAVHGASGLEYALDKLLYGQHGMSKKVPLTHNIVNWEDIPARPGCTVTTTIDIAMQDIVENLLQHHLDSLQAHWGTVVLMEVQTGDIKAIASFERTKNGRYVESLNHAIQAYEPGSIMKTISMVIALEDGFVNGDPDSDFYTIDHNFTFGGGAVIKDHAPSPWPVGRFLESSSNVGMVKLVAPHFAHDPNSFRERIAELGFLDTLNTHIAGERPPQFAHLDIKRGGLCDLGRQTYGYTSQIPPLYSCAFYNAIANDGRFVRPRLVSKIHSEKGDSIINVSYVREQMCSPQTAATVRKMLHRVIHGDRGTARSVKRLINKVDIAGKTGTAEVANELTPEQIKAIKDNPQAAADIKKRGYNTTMNRLSFCGFFPYEKPRYTCIVVVSEPSIRCASSSSGQLLAKIANRLYSRGLMGNNPDFRDDAAPRADDTQPVLYATPGNTANPNLNSALSATSVKRLPTPSQTAEGTIPDVSGLGLRQAIFTLEEKGYNVNFTGNGAVLSQYPDAGTSAPPGTSVTLTLEQR